MPQGELYLGKIAGRDPSFGNEGLPPYIVVEKIEGLIDQLLFLHNILPDAKRLPDPDQLRTPAHASVVKNGLQVLQSVLNFTECVRALVRIGVDWEDCGSHRFGDLADLGKENVTVGEDNEDVLPGLFAGGRIDEGLDNVGMIHVQVATKNTPENAFEGRDAAALDRTGNKSNSCVRG